MGRLVGWPLRSQWDGVHIDENYPVDNEPSSVRVFVITLQLLPGHLFLCFCQSKLTCGMPPIPPKGVSGSRSFYIIRMHCLQIVKLQYVATKFTSDPQLFDRVSSNFPSLIWSVNLPLRLYFKQFSLPGPDFSMTAMLDLLLRHGADPNDGFQGHSEWRGFLEWSHRQSNEERNQLGAF